MISPEEGAPGAGEAVLLAAVDDPRSAAHGASVRLDARDALLCAVGVALVAFNMRTAVASVPPVLGHFGLGGGGQSLLTTIPVLAFGAGAFAGPALRDRAGEEVAIFALMLGLLGGLVARALWPGWALFPATLLAGLAVALLNVLLPSLVKRRFPVRAAALMAAYPAVMTIGSSLAAAGTVPVLHASSLHWALGIWALPLLLGIAVWLPQLRGQPPSRARSRSRLPLPIWRTPLAWQVMLTMGLNSLIFYGEFSWLPTIYRERGLSDAQAGLLLSALSLIGLVGNIAAPLIAARLPTQRPVVAAIVA
ncbi:MAG TPA: MFS transporter, partial [Dehalococcoidia bacterium]|nr:MFS transporter [Dehalococcoidia bacterium]